MSMQPALAIHTTASGSLTSGKRMIRAPASEPEGSGATGIQPGMCGGRSFWKKWSPAMPSGRRIIVKGRSRRWGTRAGATAR